VSGNARLLEEPFQRLAGGLAHPRQRSYSQAELLTLLNTPSTADASLILARQLIAAKLNILNFSNPAAASSAIANADGLLAGFGGKLPYGVTTSSVVGIQMESHATPLQNYNADLLTPGCTP
jgi:hypothetical protein